METLFLNNELNTSLNKRYYAALNILSVFADELGLNAYIIGGVARDLILQKPIYDIDIVIEGNAIEFCKKAEEKGLCKISRISEDFGTAKIIFPDNLEMDVASTRIEKYPVPGHLPVVEKIGCSLQEDVLRRDFTVNAIAISINQSSFGKVIDLLNGIKDINKKQLRILHDNSFIDDPTRIIRALRFSEKLSFSLESHTKQLCEQYLKEFDSKDICYERIKQVTKLAFNLNSKELYERFTKHNIYKLLTPEYRLVKSQAIKSAISRNLRKIELDDIWFIYFACLVPEKHTQKLNLTAKEQQTIRNLEQLLNKGKVPNNNVEIYNFFKNMTDESVICYSAIKNSPHAQKYLDELKDTTPELNGKDLLNLGFEEGETIGHALNELLKAKLDNKISSKEQEIAFVKKFLK